MDKVSELRPKPPIRVSWNEQHLIVVRDTGEVTKYNHQEEKILREALAIKGQPFDPLGDAS